MSTLTRTERRLGGCTVVLLALALTAAALGTPAPVGLTGPTGPMSLPDDWLGTQRGLVGTAERVAAARAARAEAAAAAARTARLDPALAAADWQLEGPTNIGGRVVDIAVHPTELNTVYVAAASGGVWRSTDAGVTFHSVWPDDAPQGMGALAIGGDGTLYAGTGEANPGGGSIVFGGEGVFRSRDDGASWEVVGLEASGAIGRIVVDPTDPSRVLVAAAGDLFVPGGERGLYESRDGGDTWTRLLAPANDTTGAVDLAVDPTDPGRVFVAMWDHLREPDLRRYGGVGSALWRTEDGGSTWERLGGGLPEPSADVGRIGVALAPSLPDVMFAIVIDTLGGFDGFYKSVDGGDTWTDVATIGDPAGLYFSQSSFGWWFGRIWVDPIDPNAVFVAGVFLAASHDGGLTFAPTATSLAGYPHADQHAMAWDPLVPSRVYLGNDGGVYRHDARAAVNTGWVPATHQPWVQFYSADVSQTDAGRLVGGAQDNGANRNYHTAPDGSLLLGPAADTWNGYNGGDGEATLIDPTDPDIVYGCSQYGSCVRSEDGGTTTTGFGPTLSGQRNWFTPLMISPHDPQVLYYAGDIVNRSEDRGRTWTAISPVLSEAERRDPQYPYGTATTIALAASDPDVVWVGLDEGAIWWTTDGGEHWQQVAPEHLPGDWVTRLAVDPRDADTVYATFSGFRSGDPRPKVLATVDGGRTWLDRSGDLPGAPVNDVLVLDEGLVVATDVGVYLSRDGGSRWLRVGTGLPMVPVLDLAYQAAERELVAATFGRSMYRLRLPPAGPTTAGR